MRHNYMYSIMCLISLIECLLFRDGIFSIIQCFVVINILICINCADSN